ncbi:MAG: DoxX family protein [Pseudomonadota bacterium]
MNALQTFSAPVGRVFLAFIFIMSGFSKISAYEGTQGYMEAMGVPGVLLPLVIVLEIVGGALIALGFQARLTALVMAGFSLLSAILFHANFSDQMQMISFMKNVAIAGGFLMIVAHGAGAFSLDNRRNQ